MVRDMVKGCGWRVALDADYGTIERLQGMAKHVLRIGPAGPLVRYTPNEPWTPRKNPYERRAYLLGLRAGAGGAMAQAMDVRYAPAWQRGFSEGCGVRHARGGGQPAADLGIVTIVTLPPVWQSLAVTSDR